MSEVKVCDRCGKVFGSEEIPSTIEMSILRGYTWCRYSGDLCKVCTESFEKWIAEGKQ